MQADSSIRILLALILVCLVVLVFQGFGGERQARYKVSVVKSPAPWLMRVDTATGRVDQFVLKGDRSWVALEGSRDPAPTGDGDVASADPAPPATSEAPEPPEPPAEPVAKKPPIPRQASAPKPKPRPTPSADASEAPAPPPEPEPSQADDDAETEVEALALALSPSNPPEIRAWAASQLGSFDREASVPVLVETLGDTNANVVVAAIEALDATGDERGRTAIRALVDHPDPAIRDAAREAVAGP